VKEFATAKLLLVNVQNLEKSVLRYGVETRVILMKVVDIDFQNTVIPYFRRAPPKRKTKHMALDGSTGTRVTSLYHLPPYLKKS
jgi:hypothetical protein